jgi:hypothetical protein
LFVEKEIPLASYVDFDVKSYVETSLVLIFSGVPYYNPDIPDLMDSDGTEDDESMTSGSSESGIIQEHSESRKDLFDGVVYGSLVCDALNLITMEGFVTQEKMIETIDRHRRKIMEGLEEEPHEFLCSQIVPDVIRYFLGTTSSDTRYKRGVPNIGSRSEVFRVLESLEAKDAKFWVNLTKKWITEAAMVEVKMIPDLDMAKKLSEKASKLQESRVSKIGEKGLLKLDEEVQMAIEENKINIPDEEKKKMPLVPDVSKVDRIQFRIEKIITHEPPFQEIQLVATETLFTHFRLAFNIQSIPLNLRPYLVLFQELLYDSDMEYKEEGKVVFWNYKQVSDEAARLFISHEAAVGFGNDVWNSSWLSEVFMLYANTEEKNWKKAFKVLITF